MLLREIYQHANADCGRLSNSRIFFADRFTGWAILMYGQDIHLLLLHRLQLLLAVEAVVAIAEFGL